MKLLDAEDCHVWSTVDNRDLFATVEAGSVHSCPEKVLNGSHRVTFTYVDTEDEMRTEIYEGPWKNGRMGPGRWVDHNSPLSPYHSNGYHNDEGQRIGESKNGEFSFTTQFRNGKEHGTFTVNHEDGFEAKLEYREGLKHGSDTVINFDGENWTRTWANGKLHGKETVTNTLGNLVSTTEYTEGKKNGTHIQNHYANGDDSNFRRQEEIQYVDDVPVGTKIVRNDDNSDGEVDGVPKIPYVEGKKLGTEKWYDEAEELILTYEYVDGEGMD